MAGKMSHSALIGYINKFMHRVPEEEQRTREELEQLPYEELARMAGPLFGIERMINAEKKQNRPFEVCFTGFDWEDAERLKAITASNEKFKVVGSVTKNLDFLVRGQDPGPKKMDKAEEQGVKILYEGEFLHLLETVEAI